MTVVIAWIAAVVVIGGISSAAGSAFRSEFSLPDVESQRGFEIFEDRFGGDGSGQTGQIVFEAEQGVEDPAVRSAMVNYLAEVDEIDDVIVRSPYEDDNETQISADGTIAFAEIEIPRDASVETGADIGAEMDELAPELDGLRVEIGGVIFAEFEPPETEFIGLAFAIFVLLIGFGSVLAMGLPIGTAIGGIGAGVGIVTILSNVVEMPDFTSLIAIMIGLGVGIDYALFIVTRFREELHRGRDPETATGIAIDTAGRAVLFAGTTVIISLLGMLLMGVQFVRGLGIGASITVAATMVASITLLPAVLGFVGPRVEVTRYRGIVAAAIVAAALFTLGIGADPATVTGPILLLAVAVMVIGSFRGPLRRTLPQRKPKPIEQTVPYRWSRWIQRNPWPAVLGGLVVLVLLALPVLGLRLGFADEGNFSEDTTTRQAYDLISEGFGPGTNGPLLVVAELPAGGDDAVLDRITAGLASTDGIDRFSEPIVSDDGDGVFWRVIPETSPQDEDTTDLVNTLRDEVIPAATDGSAVEPAVTGSVAVAVDFATYLGDRLPLFFGVVLALSFILLMAVFRSLLVPLKAVLMNLISIGAAYGVVVAVFQWGWGGSILNIEPAPVESWLPMMMFAIVFGLSMDYEVFLLSRVKEEYDRTGDNAGAVADGLAATARVITAAAAIMVVVFGSFMLETDRGVKMFGLGLAVAVALDATIVRMLLVPATMELLGDRNWWLPRWLDRLIPKIDVEGGGDEPDGDGEPGGGADRRERVPAGV
ncbi:MAG: MMPL family transporter [Acidimicrobiales bacterium]